MSCTSICMCIMARMGLERRLLMRCLRKTRLSQNFPALLMVAGRVDPLQSQDSPQIYLCKLCTMRRFHRRYQDGRRSLPHRVPHRHLCNGCQECRNRSYPRSCALDHVCTLLRGNHPVNPLVADCSRVECNQSCNLLGRALVT